MKKLEDNITNLKGIGEKSASLYSKIGIHSLGDVITYFPRDYIKYEQISDLSRIDINSDSSQIVAVEAVLLKRPLVKRQRRLEITSAQFVSLGQNLWATWFHMPYLSKMLSVGSSYVLRGKITVKGDSFYLEQPLIFTKEQYEELLSGINPVYSLTKGLTNNAVTKTVKKTFEVLDKSDYDEELYEIHFPQNEESLFKARKKLVFDEFLLFILRLRKLKASNEASKNNFNIIEVAECNRIIEKLPYSLTNAQQKVWGEIKSDLCKNHSMSRLVQGDVGCGKTIIAFLAAIMTGINGYQSAVMAPTEILAQQHFEGISKLIKDNNLNLKAVLLTGSLSAAQKKNVRRMIEEKEADIVIGTHALIQEKVTYANLALVITDEQHRFGVNQRKVLSQKNSEDNVHVLVMSATPIPRTLAIILYGDLSISVIDEVPSHKKPIKNAVVGGKFRAKSYEHMKKEIENGHQCYVICPLVEESEGLDAKNVIDYAVELTSVFDESVNIGVLHGKMKSAAKQKVMDAFLRNDIQILVSTTVVEVGVNVPNATVMLIEDADRFGLAQLHQLRGRIGRGESQSYCIFMTDNDNEKTLKRLEILNKSNDGFEIAGEDLKKRGPGDMFGFRQSGDLHFKIADVFLDSETLKEAAAEADRILKSDPDLLLPEHEKLKVMLAKTLERSEISNTL